LGSPLGRRGGVPRGEHGTHSEGWAGDKRLRRSRTLQRARDLLLSVAIDQHVRVPITC